MAAPPPRAAVRSHVPVPPLTPDDLPPGYRRAGAPPDDSPCCGVRGRSACRWLPPAGAPASAPLAVDVTVTVFDRRKDALRRLTDTPPLPDELAVRPLFPPRIGDETVSLRADVTEGDARYVLYRVDIQVGRYLATVAATWRWPAGSPAWVYDRARRLAERLAACGDEGPV